MTKSNLEQVNIVEAAFPVALYKVEEYIKQGYRISQTREPIYLAWSYDIIMVKGDEIVFDEDPAELSEAEGEHNSLAESPVVLDEDSQAGVNAALDKSNEEEKNEKPVAKRGPKPKVK